MERSLVLPTRQHMSPTTITGLFLGLLMFLWSAHASADDVAVGLGIPAEGHTWRIDAMFGAERVTLQLPEQVELVNRLSPELANTIRRRVSYRVGNLDLMQSYAAAAEELAKRAIPTQTPEYRRKLIETVISLHPSDGELRDPLFRHMPLLDALPAYTRIHLFIPTYLRAQVEESIKSKPYANRIKLHNVDIWVKEEDSIRLVHSTTRWTQDLFEVVTGANGHDYILAPPARYQINDLSRSDNSYLQALATEKRKVVSIPIYFRGGNVLIGNDNNGKRVALIGERELTNNRQDFYTGLFAFPNRTGVLALYKELLGVDHIEVIPNTRNLFHLDMAVSFLGDNVAALIEPLTVNPQNPNSVSADDLEVIESLRAALKRNSFKIISIPTTADRMARFQSPVNIIPYTHRDRTRLEALIPQFPDVFLENGKSINRLTEEAYLQAGVIPIWVEDRFHQVHGNLHCAMSVLR